MASIRYEPAIDGLRSVAIIAVLIFHLAPRWLPGGFTGVDVFFVISGYLITGIQLADLDAGTFRLGRFYQRRIARIFPAMLCVACVTLLVAGLLYDAQERASAGANFTAALLSVANLKVMLQGNYFHLSRDTQPFMHFWSLSLEEQFYVVFPLLLAASHRFDRRVAAVAGFVLTAASLVACVIITPTRPAMAFFLLPTRAWELMLGAILAHQVRGKGSRVGTAAEGILQFAGVLGLLASFVCLDEATTFPGPSALLPTLATVAVIAGARRGEGIVARMLGCRLPVLIGRLSYSLYLWHWPIDSFVDYVMPLRDDMTRGCVKIAFTVAASWLSYRFVESPLRRRLAAPGAARAAFGMAIASLVLLAPIGMIVNREGYPRPRRDDVPLGGRIFVPPSGRGVVSLYGDSIGASFARVTRDVCKDAGFGMRSMALPAEKPWPRPDGTRDGMWEEAVRAWGKDRPDVVIIGVDWQTCPGAISDVLERMIGELDPLTDRIVLLTPAPRLPVPDVREYARSGGSFPLREDGDDEKVRVAAKSALERATRGKVVIVHVDPSFVDSRGVLTVFDDSGRSLFHDRGHLGYRGTARVASALGRALGGDPGR